MKVICKKCKAAIDEAINQLINQSMDPSILHLLTLTALLSRMYPAPMRPDMQTIVHINTAEIDGDRHSYDDDGDILTSAIKDGLPRWLKDSSDE